MVQATVSAGISSWQTMNFAASIMSAWPAATSGDSWPLAPGATMMALRP
jgi:hypothetical protein